MCKGSVAKIPGRRHKPVTAQSLSCSFLIQYDGKRPIFFFFFFGGGGGVCPLTKHGIRFISLQKVANSSKLGKGDRHFKTWKSSLILQYTSRYNGH